MLVFFRSFVFLCYEQVSFDSDQAILGLMAKHASQFRALPLFQYGLDYMLAIETYATVPFFWAGGVSVTTLKLPLVLANCGIALSLIVLLHQTLALRPALAMAATLPFLLPPPITSATLVETLGGNVAPLVFILLLWVHRRRPMVFGVLFALGFLTREFSAYGVAAIVVSEAMDGSLLTRKNLRDKLIALLMFAITYSLIDALRSIAPTLGPGSGPPVEEQPRAALNALRFFCWDAVGGSWLVNFRAVAFEQWPVLFGTARVPLRAANLASATWQGVAWTSELLLAVTIAVAVRLPWLLRRRRESGASPGQSVVSPLRPDARFCWYLILVGMLASVMYAISRCDHVGLLQQRYILLALFIPVGVAGLYLTVEPSRSGRALAVIALAAWALLSAREHLALGREYLTTPPPNIRRELANALLSNNVRFGMADYWDSYVVTFLTNERVILVPDRFTRILEYEYLVDAHPEAVVISREPCAGGARLGHRWICRP